jgi:hypothetical protein
MRLGTDSGRGQMMSPAFYYLKQISDKGNQNSLNNFCVWQNTVKLIA